MPPARAAATTAAADDGQDADPLELEGKVTHSREKLKLCEQIVEDHFGPLTAHVAAVLLQRGRLPLSHIERFVRSTKPASTAAASTSTSSMIPTRAQVQHSILTLVQHNVMYHSRVEAGGSIVTDVDQPGGTEYFEINPDAILNRARFGSYLELCQRLWGQEGFDLVSLVLQNGKLQVQDLLQQLESSSPSTRPLLTHLLLSKYLVEAFQIEHISPQDLRIAYFQEAAMGQKKPLSAKVAREIEGKVRERLVSEREMSSTQGCVERNGVDHVPVSGKKSSSSKRRKLAVEEEGAGGKSDRRKYKRRSDGSSDTDADRSDDAEALDRSKGRKRKKSLAPNEVNGKSAKPPSWRSQLPEVEQRRLDQLTADDNTYVRVNFDRFDVHVRNEVVHSLVSSSFNKSTADVYLALIQSGDTRTTESGGWPSMSTTRGASISLTQFATELDLGSVLSHGLDKSGFKMMGGVTKPTKYEFACEYVAILSRVDDVMALSSANENSSKGGSGAATQAQALSRPITYLVPGPGVSSSGVVTATGSRIPAAVSVDFASAGRKMKWNLLKSTVEKVFSPREARIIGVLRREGKLEEKHISKLALLSLGDTREACSRLFSCSIISLQEVPKSSDRNPQRTFFLYFLDYSRALAWLSDHIYKTHSRISQRRAFEQQREETLLAKTARTDVQLEGIENVLGQSERIRLEQCRSKLALLTVEEQRVERESWILSKMVS